MLNKILLFLFILLLPTQLGKFFFLDYSYLSGVRIDYLAPVLYLTDILAVVLIILNFRHLSTLFRSIAFYVFLNAVLLNIFFALNPYVTLFKSLKIFEMLFLFVIFKCYFEENKGKYFKNFSKLLLIALNLGAAIELLLSILQVMYKHAIQGPFYFLGERYFNLSMPDIAKVSINGVETLRAYGTFSHPNSMAGFYLLLYFFVLTFPAFNKYKKLKYLFLLFSGLLLLLTFSKIPILIFLGLNVFYFIRNPKIIPNSFHRALALTGIIISGGVFLVTKGDPFSLTKRSELVGNAVSIFTQSPFFGTGLGGYLLAQAQFPIKYSYFFLQPVHDIFLLYLTEAGIMLTIVTLYLLIRYFRSQNRTETYFYLIFIVLLTGSFDHYWLTLQQNMLLLPLLFALTLNSRLTKI